MATVTSINANPPNRPLPNGGGFLAVREDAIPQVAQLVADDPIKLTSVIGLVVGTGMGISFSCTSDGGALAVHVFDGEKRDKRYVTTTPQMQALLEAIEDYAGAKLMGQASTLAKLPPRGSSTK